MRVVYFALGALVCGAFAACGSSKPTLAPEQVTSQVESACSGHRAAREAGFHAVSGPTFTADSLNQFQISADQALTLIEDIKAQKDQQVQLDDLSSTIEQLASSWSIARSALEERSWADAQQSIDEGRKQAKQIDAAAAALHLSDCSSATWVGGWFDEAQKYLDQHLAATKPTGDFATDVKAACDRFTADVNAVPIPFTAVDAQLWAFALQDAMRLFVRDIAALKVPEGKRAAVDALKTASDDLSSHLSELVSAAANGTNDAGGLIASIQSGLDDVTTKIEALGVTC